MNLLGPLAAATAFLSIWAGHVAVRKVEAASRVLWLPATIFVALGLTLESLALTTFNLQLSTVFGILGLTLLWDALELARQERRIRKGHAPANPHNPRHAAILSEPGSHATTLDLLKRDPVGRPVTATEAVELIRRADHGEAAQVVISSKG